MSRAVLGPHDAAGSDSTCNAERSSMRTSSSASSSSRLAESLATAMAVDDQVQVAHALRLQGHVARDQGDFMRARALYESARTIGVALGLRLLEAYALEGLASVAEREGDLVEAATHAAEALRLLREAGHPAMPVTHWNGAWPRAKAIGLLLDSYWSAAYRPSAGRSIGGGAARPCWRWHGSRTPAASSHVPASFTRQGWGWLLAQAVVAA